MKSCFAHPDLDGTWARLLPDDMLELRDPNDGQSAAPESKSRHQYRVLLGVLLTRHLPPTSVGDVWHDFVPEWEVVRLRGGELRGLLMDFWAYHGGSHDALLVHHMSLRSIDVGYDPRPLGMHVELRPDLVVVDFEEQGDAGGSAKTVVGDYDHIVRTLAAYGYGLIVDRTPNGRYIEFAGGRYVVQPHDDNYLIRTDSLADAHEAYFDPAKYRF